MMPTTGTSGSVGVITFQSKQRKIVVNSATKNSYKVNKNYIEHIRFESHITTFKLSRIPVSSKLKVQRCSKLTKKTQIQWAKSLVLHFLVNSEKGSL